MFEFLCIYNIFNDIIVHPSVFILMFMLLYFSFNSFSGALQMNYEDFCHIATVCTEQIGQKCKRFFSPSNFMKFEKDDSGRIAILPFYLYVMRTVSYFVNSSSLICMSMLCFIFRLLAVMNYMQQKPTLNFSFHSYPIKILVHNVTT